MISLTTGIARITSCIIVTFLIMPGVEVTGLSSWTQNAAEFKDGLLVNASVKNDSLTLDLYPLNNWVKMGNSSSPSPRTYPAMAYDSKNHLGVLFGGGDDLYNDTWTYNVLDDKWTNKLTLVSPSPRTNSAIVYDSDNDLIILFGGVSGYSNHWINDTWTYDLKSNTWTNMSPAEAPPADTYQMVYDPIEKVCIAVGGGHDYSSWRKPEVWTYSVIDNIWKKQEMTTYPSGWIGAAMVYDESSHVIILFGGYDIDMHPNTDTWILNPETFNWTQKWPSVTPPFRVRYAMVYDSKESVSLLFGGWSGSDFGDTWEYNSTNNNWSEIITADAPMPRDGHQMYYDSSINATVLFGGYNYDNTDSTFLNDTWCFMSDVFPWNGTLISAPKDTGGITYFGTMDYNASISLNTCIKIQLRTADSLENITNKSYIGPDGTNLTFYTYSPQWIASVHNGSRWIQTKVILNTNNFFETPLLKTIRINYNLIQFLSVISPLGGENWTGIQNISWTAYDGDNDSLAFDIYLENGSASILLAVSLGNDSRQWSWNTNTTPNGTYRIRIIARDDNPSIPLIVNASSSNFTIHHLLPPPPNHPPHVELISPANNSYLQTNSVRLQWKGTDPDGDSLTYIVYYSDQPLLQGNVLSNITKSDYLDLTGLLDNMTYYWTVNATDGKANSTDVPTDIWCFTIRMPPANIPVRITSIPTKEATVGEEYIYNITSVDEDGDIPFYFIVTGPPNMTLNSSTGLLRWIPVDSDAGNHTITIQVSDGRGSTDEQTFTITVVSQANPPPPPYERSRCEIIFPVNGSVIKGQLQIRGKANNGTLPLILVQIRIDDGNWTNVIGLENWTLTINSAKLVNGNHTIEARSFDGSHYSDTASVNFNFSNSEPTIIIVTFLWYPVLIIMIAVFGLCIYLIFRKKKNTN